ncbi:activator of Hsp90 ATPase [Lipomyces orientalis]|uniref:Activator of Hsp90 ATPase n=1 Tax=Lipomyces orientalis TaxID=1233043 RepID=A0ACC3TJW6_9ASCO
MVLHNPNNWHWVDKNCVEWSKTYFSEKLVGISATSEDNQTSVSITKLASLTGDVDVNQRKGKVISLFDVKIVLDYEGSVESTNVTGTISIPEVAYDTEEDEYVFDVSISGETKEKQPAKELIREKIVPELRKKLSAFGVDLIETHGKDIQHPVEENRSRFTSSNQGASGTPISAATTATTTTKTSSSSAAYNTTTLRLEAVFNTTAAELYTTFLDPGRVAAWTRSPPVKFTPQEGGEYALFGGNVSGKFMKLVDNKSIEMLWRLKDWKPEHFADLKIAFDQGQGETKAVVTWKGVPVGQEDVTRRNFEEYYVKSIKLTFGFGAVL